MENTPNNNEENNNDGHLNFGSNDQSPYEPPKEESKPHLDQNFGFSSNLNLGFIREKTIQTREEVGKFIIGQAEMIDLLLIGVFTNGHILLEGVPGIAKTLTSRVMSRTLSVDFARIQFTPDMMPSDILGTSIFNMKNSEFEFKKGPIFSNLVLIDEINRAPAKTQAALFEAMEERQITFDGITYKMEFPFLVVATQNPVEQEGTYNLPEAQLDRFLFKIKLDYPTLDEETQILNRFKNNISTPDINSVKHVFTPQEIKDAQDIIQQISVEDQLVKYIASVVDKTRNHAKLYLGASPRASLSILKSSKAMAAIRGRDFVTPDDIQSVAMHVLNHRMILTPDAEMEGVSIEDVIKEIVHSIEVPR